MIVVRLLKNIKPKSNRLLIFISNRSAKYSDHHHRHAGPQGLPVVQIAVQADIIKPIAIKTANIAAKNINRIAFPQRNELSEWGFNIVVSGLVNIINQSAHQTTQPTAMQYFRNNAGQTKVTNFRKPKLQTLSKLLILVRFSS